MRISDWSSDVCSSDLGKTTRRPRSGGVDRRGQIPEMVSIHVRPPEIEDRLMPGHWEGDLIKGKANASAVGTLNERTSGYLMLIKLNDATATSAVEGFSEIGRASCRERVCQYV